MGTCSKTPLLILDLRNKQSRASARAVSLLNVYPTLVELCGLPKNENVEGRSMASILNNENANWTDLAITSKEEGTHSLRNDRYRYTVYSDGF